jgi:hypothetical protein
VINKIKVLSVEEKVKLIREIEYEKRKTAVCRKFGLVNDKIQISGKAEPNY